MSKKVNLFIVGAPKSGTTAIASYLKNHSDIYFPSIKEPHFFAEDFSNFQIIKSNSDYYDLYTSCKNQKYLGDASVWYLYSECAIKKIWEFNNESKLLVLLRNPLELLPSLHKQLLYTLDEDERSFEASWKLQHLRAKGEHLPAKNREAKMLQFTSVVNYYEQLKRVFKFFKRDQVKIIIFDDFVENPHRIYLEILSFLSLKDDNQKEFPKMNQRKTPRFSLINKFIARPPKRFTSFVRFFKAIFRLKDLRILNRLDHLNRKHISSEKISLDLKKEITSKTLPSIKNLESLLERDLSFWYK